LLIEVFDSAAASCPNGRLTAHDEFDFITGLQESGAIVRRCAENGQ
jgi:hypothetical protein